MGGLPLAGGRAGTGGLGRPGTPCSSPSGPPHLRASSRVPAASQSSGCYDSDSLELPRPEEGSPEDGGPGGLGTRAQAANGGSERAQLPRSSGLRRQAIQNWQRRPRRHSTEGEEGDISDVGSRTTESEAEGPSDAPRPGPAMAGPLSSCRLSSKSWRVVRRDQSFHSAGPSQGTQGQGSKPLGLLNLLSPCPRLSHNENVRLPLTQRPASLGQELLCQGSAAHRDTQAGYRIRMPHLRGSVHMVSSLTFTGE